ncbi:M28 family peptidase [Aureibaculum sp. 2210JD6-5]|uniref:M28 family peptidase n=1 Tax=Aureibaculum sp. 2210JD6-5 TaxID=3103957 RepID=UPI002AAE128C|nr:M28 family peptidase [Aureibaculum sp. 2210JD6-5]MDY7395687.1 M28 family peptidase [Aureibaculum sp. 2210JD6-5]
MKYKCLFYGLVFLLILSGCKSQITATESSVDNSTSAVEFSKDSLLHHIKVLSSDDFEGRRTDTEGAAKARNYITSKFKQLGVLPLSNNYHQSFSFTSRRDTKSYNGINVLGYVKGGENPDKYIVISAHYDHLGMKDGVIYNGADDDASGTSALFSFAEYFKKNPPKNSVILAAFDAEEMGLQGSKYYVDNPIVEKENILLNINMDMISRSDKNELYVVGTRFYENLKSAIDNAELPANFKLLIGHDGSDDKQNWTNSSDHGSFHKKQIPFLYFGVEDHKDYHKETDEFENIHPEFYAKAVKVIISVFENLDNSL